MGRGLVMLSSWLYFDIVCPLSLSYTDSSGEIQVNLRKAERFNCGWDLIRRMQVPLFRFAGQWVV